MSDLNEKVIIAKNALMTALGDNCQKYLTSMKFWFRNKWSKEEFDIEARKLLTPDKLHYHNHFLIAILNKIDCFHRPKTPVLTSIVTTTNNSDVIVNSTNNNSSAISSNTRTTSSSSSSSKKRKKSRFTERFINFEPHDICEFLTENSMNFIQPPINGENLPPQTISPQRYCVQELFLPDTGFIMGRLLVGAWENGLINVDDAVAEFVATAVQVLLKNIISSIIMKRKNYKINQEGNYFYDIGKPIKDPFLKNTVSRQKIDDTPVELDKEIVTVHLQRKNNDDVVFLADCEQMYPTKKQIITVKDVYIALQDRNIIPSHLVYAINMERITQMLH